MIKNLTFFIFLLSILIGCTTTLPSMYPGQILDNNQSIVFGRLAIDVPKMVMISLTCKDESKKVYRIEQNNWISRIDPHTSEDTLGYFIAQLPQGHYQCFNITQQNTNLSGSGIKVDYVFDVPPASTVYIGTLYYQEIESHNYLLFERRNVRFAVLNQRDETIEYFNKRGYHLKNVVESILQTNIVEH